MNTYSDLKTTKDKIIRAWYWWNVNMEGTNIEGSYFQNTLKMTPITLDQRK